MHHKFFSQAHPLFALHEGENATPSRACPDVSGLAPAESARSPDWVGARVRAPHLWGGTHSIHFAHIRDDFVEARRLSPRLVPGGALR